jgi:hypothetical protein
MDNGVAHWEKEQRRELWVRIIRRCIGIPLLFSYPWLGGISPFLALLGCILIAPDIAGYFSKFAGNILWSRREGKERPLYGIPESLVAKGKYAEAEKEYEKIIQEFPNEVKPHVDMINIAVRWLNDGQLAEELYRRGMGLLQNPADRDKLTESYSAIRTRLKNQDESNREAIPFEELKEIRERLARDRNKYWR